jgi:DNA helicase II / ATP-dependent DNA helicase PcrA
MLLDELVPTTLKYLRLNPLAEERAEFEHVLVDDYQNLNRADMAVVDLLASKATSLSVVGDDDQSIYRFRFAFPEGIRGFAADDEMEFVECHRPTSVVALANALVGRDPNRAKPDLAAAEGNGDGEVHDVAFSTADHEAEGVAEFISRRIEERRAEAGDCLALCNSRRHARRIRQPLDDRGVRGETFFREQALESEAAKEAMTVLTLRLDPADRVAERAWLGIDQPEARESTYRRLWTAADGEGVSIGEAMGRIKGRL